jgi:hypothetical protein
MLGGQRPVRKSRNGSRGGHGGHGVAKPQSKARPYGSSEEEGISGDGEFVRF